MAQPTSGGLGTRIAAAFRAAFANGADRVVVAGCDIPALSAAEVRAGFAALSPEAPSLRECPWGAGGPRLAHDNGWDVTLKAVVWLKRVHPIVWSGGSLESPRPAWVKSNTAYWWCLSCRAQMSALSAVEAHVTSTNHWKKRKWYEPEELA